MVVYKYKPMRSVFSKLWCVVGREQGQKFGTQKLKHFVQLTYILNQLKINYEIYFAVNTQRTLQISAT